MIANLKPYAEYKESGLPWLGQVPGHWTAQTLRRFLRSGDGIKIGPFGSQLKLAHMSESGFKVYGQANVIAGDIRRGSKYVDEAKFDQLRECEVRPGDLLVTMMGTSGRCMVVPDGAVPGLMDSHLLRLRLRSNGVGPAFTALSVDQAPYVKQQVEITGKGSIMHGLNSGMVKNLALLVPPPDEQAAIVRFLDWATGRLERAIRAKRKVIALLNEQKQAIIHRAVTRGLDPAVPLKPSGIPWLGDIPRHWEVRRAKYLFREVDERSRDGSEELLSVSHITGVTPRSQKNITMFKAASYAGHKLCRPGDLVVNTMWAWMGALGVSTYTGIISPAYAVYRPRRPEGIVGIYLDGLLRSSPYVSNIICRSTGLRASRLRLYPEEFFRLPIIQPPADEQRRIVERIQGETSGLHFAISRLEREIELLREYRTRLVADVVTGKLDVRETAVRLPDEAPLDNVEDDTDLTDETETADEEAAA